MVERIDVGVESRLGGDDQPGGIGRHLLGVLGRLLGQHGNARLRGEPLHPGPHLELVPGRALLQGDDRDALVALRGDGCVTGEADGLPHSPALDLGVHGVDDGAVSAGGGGGVLCGTDPRCRTGHGLFELVRVLLLVRRCQAGLDALENLFELLVVEDGFGDRRTGGHGLSGLGLRPRAGGQAQGDGGGTACAQKGSTGGHHARSWLSGSAVGSGSLRGSASTAWMTAGSAWGGSSTPSE